MEKKMNFHGSDLEKIQEVYGINKDEIISFSANVNPLGVSPMLKTELAKKIDVITSYPDRDYTALRKSIGAYTHSNPDHILVGNGSTELISLMAHYLKPKKALLLAPTYSEYEREIGLSGGKTDYFELKEIDDFVLDLASLKIALEAQYDLLVICNPNNPTSSALSSSVISEILTECRRYHTFVMIDETYVEFAPDTNAVTAIPLAEEFDNFVVLRGVSKFFAAPGLRLGYAVTGNQELIHTVNEMKNPWSINSLAEQAGIIMYSDHNYIANTRALMHREQERLYDILSASERFKAYKPSGNFILLKITDGTTADELFERAIREKMMIRNCANFQFLDSSYIRFCFMLPEQNDALISCLLS
ncbi:MAG: threonine-phosphate decarboxylase [Lachnospiraceae bacterium]